MEYSVGDTLRVDGSVYDIIGKIKYQNLADMECWFEYRMISREFKREKWLSFDSRYQEYSITEITFNVSTSGYHEIDSGTEVVLQVWGDVDVSVGDQATFKEYEDDEEERIISTECWGNEEEISVGYYLDIDEIEYYSETMESTKSSMSTNKKSNNILAVIVLIMCFFIVVSEFGDIFDSISFQSNKIDKYLEKNPNYTYVTSITNRDNQKADVYRSSYTFDMTVKDILNEIEGDTENVQQNTEQGDNSVGILTKKQYCLVYISKENEILVQISSRKYAYGSDQSPYHASNRTHHYYRRYYYSRGYFSDYDRYKKHASPYSNYSGDYLDSNYNDTYNNYSSNIRQSSPYSRYSSGGGTSYGK